MFKCEVTKKLVGPRISPVKVVLEKRQIVYRNEVNKKIVESVGWEIVKEVSVDPAYIKKLLAEEGKS